MNIHRKKKKFCCICRKHFFDWIKFSRYGKMQITAKRRHERTGDFMTMKTKRGLAVGGGTVLCAALAILIATRFAPESEATAPYTSDTSSTPPISVEISTAKREESRSIEIEKPAESTKCAYAGMTMWLKLRIRKKCRLRNGKERHAARNLCSLIRNKTRCILNL